MADTGAGHRNADAYRDTDRDIHAVADEHANRDRYEYADRDTAWDIPACGGAAESESLIMPLQLLTTDQLARYAIAEFNRREAESWADIYASRGKSETAAASTANAREWERRRDAVGDEASEG